MDSQPPEISNLERREAQTKHLANVFEQHVKPWVEDPTAPLRILSVGCANAEELPAVLHTFPNASFTGIDINNGVIEPMDMLNKNNPRVTFRQGDATKREVFGQDPWDIILFRHPQFNGSEVLTWEKIVQNGQDAVKPGGLLYIETYTSVEMKRAKDALQKGGHSLTNIVDSYISQNMGLHHHPEESDILVARKL